MVSDQLYSETLQVVVQELQEDYSKTYKIDHYHKSYLPLDINQTVAVIHHRRHHEIFLLLIFLVMSQPHKLIHYVKKLLLLSKQLNLVMKHY